MTGLGALCCARALNLCGVLCSRRQSAITDAADRWAHRVGIQWPGSRTQKTFMKTTLTALALLLTCGAFSAELRSVQTDQTTIVSGDSFRGAVLLSGTTETQEVVTLTDNTSAAFTPSTVTVFEGTQHGDFTCTSSVVTSPATRTISATLRGVTKTCYFTLVPPPMLERAEVVPSEVVGGESFTLRAWFTSVAPYGGMTINAFSTSSSISIPSNAMKVDEGSQFGQVEGSTSVVSAVYTRTVGATYAGVTKYASLTLHPSQKLLWAKLSRVVMHGSPDSTILSYELSGFAPRAGTLVDFQDPTGSFTSDGPVRTTRFGKIVFNVKFSPVAYLTTLSVSAGGVSKHFTVMVTPF